MRWRSEDKQGSWPGESASESTPPWWLDPQDAPPSSPLPGSVPAPAALSAAPVPPDDLQEPYNLPVGTDDIDLDQYAGNDGQRLLTHDLSGYGDQALTQLPQGQWVDLDTSDGGEDLWVPADSDAEATPRDQVAVFEGQQPAAAVLTASRPSDSPRNGRRRTTVDRPLSAVRPVDPDEAVQLATCFALDYLSWDEDLPTRRAEALRHYLPSHVDSTLGWSGTGRQRTDFAAPGQTMREAHWISVDVRVRVTPYERVDDHEPTSGPATEPPSGARWSAAPAPESEGWRSCPSFWVRLAIPVRRHDSGELVVDLAPIPDAHYDDEVDL